MIPVELAVARIPVEAKGLYLIIKHICQGAKANSVLVSQRKLAEVSCLSYSAMNRYLQLLVAEGWVKAEGGARGTLLSTENPWARREEQLVAELRERLNKAAFMGEALMRALLDILVDRNDAQDEAELPFLINPETGKPMRYDRFYPPSVAIEFNGAQHYGPTDAYPDSRAARHQQALDLMKLGLSHQHGIALITITPIDLTFYGIRKKVEGYLPLRQIDGEDPRVRFLQTACNRYIRKVRRAQHNPAQHNPAQREPRPT